MESIERFLEDLAEEDVFLELRITRTKDGIYLARIVDPMAAQMDILDRNGEMILSCRGDSMETVLLALDALCGAPSAP